MPSRSIPSGWKRPAQRWELAKGIEPRAYKQHRFPRRKRVYSDLKVPLTVKAVFEPVEKLTPRLLEESII